MMRVILHVLPVREACFAGGSVLARDYVIADQKCFPLFISLCVSFFFWSQFTGIKLCKGKGKGRGWSLEKSFDQLSLCIECCGSLCIECYEKINF